MSVKKGVKRIWMIVSVTWVAFSCYSILSSFQRGNLDFHLLGGFILVTVLGLMGIWLGYFVVMWIIKGFLE